jgi:HD-GYP domain-containing protein (c-di-GMP phosphodiesterase class II)
MFEKQIQEGFAEIAALARPRVSPRLPTIVETYSVALGTITLSLATWLTLNGYGGDVSWPVVAALGVVAWLAERQSVQLTTNLAMSVSVLPVLFAAVVWGPLAAMVVGMSALLAEFGPPYERWLVWSSTRALAGAFAAVAAGVVLEKGDSFGILLVAVAAASIVEALTDVVVGATTLFIRRSGSIRSTVQALARLATGTIPLYTPVIAVLAFAYDEVSSWTVMLFFVPAIAAQRLFILYQEQRRLTEDLVGANSQLEKANLSFATALVATLDARDRYTAGHSEAVAVYARDIAARLGLTEELQRRAHVAGLVHDIGKVGLPPGLLEKEGPLTLEERRQMELHTTIGERILLNVDDYAEIATIVRHHHERMDGQGYPDRLPGDDIPMVSRIIAVADAYNAMTSDRPYRDAMPSRVARMRLAQAVETQFDTTVVAAFEAILAGASEAYRMGTDPEFGIAARAVSYSGGSSDEVSVAAA